MGLISSCIDMICLHMPTCTWLLLLEKTSGNILASAVAINFSVSSLCIAVLAIQFNDFYCKLLVPQTFDIN